jgi:hypothetical protein
VKCFIKGFAALWHDPDTLPMNNLWEKERGIEMAKKNKKLKRVLLAIFFCLLVSSTANAQSPRVLWERVQVMEVKDGALNENSQWKLLETTPTYEQCMEAQRRVFEARRSDYAILKESRPKMEIWTTPNKSITTRSTLEPILISNIFYCLPDTSDPRRR